MSFGCNSSVWREPGVDGAPGEFQPLQTQPLYVYHWASTVSPIYSFTKQMQLVMDTFPGTQTYRVIEFLLTWNHSSLLALLPYNFSFTYSCLLLVFFFFISFNVAHSSVCVSKILAPLPNKPFCAAPAGVRLRSHETPGFAHCFPLFWTVSNYFAPPRTAFGGFPQNYQYYFYKITNIEEILHFISMKWLNSAFKNGLLSCHDFMQGLGAAWEWNSDEGKRREDFAPFSS